MDSRIAIYVLVSASLLYLVNCHKLVHYFNLKINGSDITNTADILLDNYPIMTFDGKDIYPSISFMVGNKLFLDLYKNIFEEFFRLFRVSVSSQYEELEYYYSCDYTNNRPTIKQHYFYNGDEYTEIDRSKKATNKNSWLITSGFRLQKWFDSEDCIIYLRSLVRRMEDSNKNSKKT
ncbi:Brix domain protein [Monkeypox virus]|uniref:MPXVgp187 n=1 Tax=Monkeypox virus TaxID=10244 RepID=A0A0F6N8V5_MONPV|nr:Brix domain protein [Monkeypox virus]AIE41146.1 hypothetical protein MPXV-Nig_SEV71_2_82-173 [Monkeypox virus]QGQ59928.1 hypothetical protein PDLMKLCO_00208 [Monkeypox virus]QJQ40322.1 hypothetical protein [Monkeypox virus]QNP12508.1 MPXVgp187 [Monkeypox virus]QNP13233.1 MPXVgp187 [Monkeypox virus]